MSLTVFTVESTGSIEGIEEADEQAGERGADWKALTGTLKNCLFVFFSLNAVKLGFHGSKRKCENMKTFFSSCAYTLYVHAFSSEDTGLEKNLQLLLWTSSSYIFLA